MEPTEPVRLPIEAELDLHTFAPRDVPSVVTEYLHAAADAGLAEVRVVHGRGTGVQRRAVHRVLARHAAVTEYWDAPESHLGATMARLRRVEPDPSGVEREPDDHPTDTGSTQ